MSTEKHDGKLEPMVKPKLHYDHTAYVSIFDDNPSTSLINISGGYARGHIVEDPDVYLDPQQALSLLAWLKQEQDTLERLAKA